MLTRKKLAKRWETTPRTVDRRRARGLLAPKLLVPRREIGNQKKG
jgi:hypothetical protein